MITSVSINVVKNFKQGLTALVLSDMSNLTNFKCTIFQMTINFIDVYKNVEKNVRV